MLAQKKVVQRVVYWDRMTAASTVALKDDLMAVQTAPVKATMLADEMEVPLVETTAQK
jgi:hypothetical protein